MKISKQALAKYLDHTLLKPNATKEEILTICKEALDYQTASVCVNAHWIKLVTSQLRDSMVVPCVVVGFPLGSTSTATKVIETRIAIDDGAKEVDMVINIGELIGGNETFVKEDIKLVAEETHKKDNLLKVIIETSYLTNDQIVTACQLAEDADADYVKTSTGFSSAGAKIDDVTLMRKTVGNRLGVKASGGIHNYNEAVAMIEAGASRLGVSATKQILA